jgi:hypothetical protein
MSKPRRDKVSLPLVDTPFAIRQRKPVPHEFVLDAMAPPLPETRSMFGCLAVYVQDKIVLILRDKRDGTADNGVWLATTEEHHQSLRRGVPEHALDSGVREERDRLAGSPGRREGFRRGRAARLRACPCGRSSNREGTWSAARLEIAGQEGGKIPEAGGTHQGLISTTVTGKQNCARDTLTGLKLS